MEGAYLWVPIPVTRSGRAGRNSLTMLCRSHRGWGGKSSLAASSRGGARVVTRTGSPAGSRSGRRRAGVVVARFGPDPGTGIDRKRLALSSGPGGGPRLDRLPADQEASRRLARRQGERSVIEVALFVEARAMISWTFVAPLRGAGSAPLAAHAEAIEAHGGVAPDAAPVRCGYRDQTTAPRGLRARPDSSDTAGPNGAAGSMSIEELEARHAAPR
jgi:hypothetical protein